MKKYLQLAICVVAALAVVMIACDYASENLPAYSLAQPWRDRAEDSITCKGKLEENEADTLSVSFPAYYTQVYFREGDTVQAGDIIAQIDTEKTIEILTNLDRESALAVFQNSNMSEALYEVLQGYWPDLSQYADSIAQLQNSDGKLIAPCDGTIVNMNISSETLNLAETVVTISRRESMKVTLEVPEAYSSRVKVGQTVRISGDAFAGETWESTISWISPNAQSSASGNGATIQAEVVLDNAGRNLKAGYNATAEIVTDVQENALMIPFECILQDENYHNYVYVYENGRVYRRFIQVGYELLDGSVVESGLDGTEQLLYNPSESLQDGQAIHVLAE